MAAEKIDLSVVIPAFNEMHIESVVAAIKSAVEKLGTSFEIIFVDDGSESELADFYDRIAANDSRMAVIHHSINYGQSTAIFSALNVCRGSKILILPSDVIASSCDIDAFHDLSAHGHDAVFGVRGRKAFPNYRRSLSTLLNILVSLTAGKRIHDIGSGLYFISKTLKNKILEVQSSYAPNCRPMNILALFLAENPAEMEIKSIFIKRPSRYSCKKLLELALLVIISLVEKKRTSPAEMGKHLSPSQWDEIAKNVERSLDNPRFDYFRSDRVLCYEQFYRLNPYPRKVLDVGCGPGHFLLFATGKGHEATGVDASTEMLKVARKRLRLNGLHASLLQIDLSQGLPFKDNTFDAVVCESVLNHVASPFSQLLEMSRVLRKDGHVILDISNKWGVAWRLSIKLSQMIGTYPKGHITWISPSGLNWIAAKAGLDILQSRGLHLIPPPRLTSIDFKSYPLLPDKVSTRLEHIVFKLNCFLEQRFPFKYLCFKYLIFCKKRIQINETLY